jgi:hypothetical protein
VDVDDLKDSLAASGTTFLDNDITQSIAAASEMVDDICFRSFGLTESDAGETRYFRTNDRGLLVIDDLVELVSVAADYDADGDYEETLTVNTHFTLGPVNAAAFGRPYEWMEARRGTRFPVSGGYVKVVGRFGWDTTPERVVKATRIIAVRLLKRDREAPFGILGAGTDGAAAIMRTDPEIGPLLRRLIRRPALTSLQLT